MGKTRTKIEYIPALKYDWLTTSFDTFVRLTMPERQFRSALILQAGITAGRRVLDFGRRHCRFVVAGEAARTTIRGHGYRYR